MSLAAVVEEPLPATYTEQAFGDMVAGTEHLYFADESDNNSGTFNAREYHRAGHRVYACKATQGLTGSQPPYALRVNEAHAAGLKVIHYHFAEPALGDPEDQMRFFLKTLEGHFIEGDRAVLDIEWPGLSRVQTIGWAKAAFAFLHSHGHPGAPIYTGLSFLLEYGHELVPPSGEMWVADYGRPGETSQQIWNEVGRSIPPGRLFAVQQTDGVQGPEPHTLPGIGGPCDVSRLASLW
jgi:hypothetical protein